MHRAAEAEASDDRKRKYNSMATTDVRRRITCVIASVFMLAVSPDASLRYARSPLLQVTAEEMEAYRMLKSRGDDPMARLSSDVLLDEDDGSGKSRSRRF